MNVSKRQIGLATATALVLGNMIGSGVFLLPASLAPYGGYSLVGWVISAVGALLLAGVFFRLAKREPRAGGPYAYSREAFGNCVGFLVAWVYWIALVGGNATIAVAFASYMSAFVPALGAHPLYGALTAMAAVWVLIAVNIAGIRSAGRLQLATTVLKILPLVALALFGFTRFDPQLLAPGPHAGSPLGAINICVAATLFAFIGVECATIPAGHVREPGKTIPRATLLGTAIAAVLYIACTAVVMGLLPASELAQSQAPFADAGRLLWGAWASWLIAGAAAISCFGALNGWTLIAGQFPQAVAKDGLFPRFFARESGRGTPVPALLVAGVINSLMVLANYSRGMVAMFTFMVLLTTLGNVVCYLFCTIADVVLARRSGRPLRARNLLLAVAAFGFCLWAVVGAGKDAVFWNLVLLSLGLPLYAWQARHARAIGSATTDSTPP
ncbi:MAG TPA: amino acid permease [Rhodanobacteraceae bacterium]|jgi:APA family basic amino acid/polyamine antiporter|nr:amino acid permease [Rhodanobacteraceae bacterium]